jgi:hypothetical protein
VALAAIDPVILVQKLSVPAGPLMALVPLEIAVGRISSGAVRLPLDGA